MKDKPFGTGNKHIDSIGRWIIRQAWYSDIGGYYLSALELFFGIVTGISNSLWTGLGIIIIIRILRAVAGHLDVRLGLTRYRTEFGSKKVTAYTMIKGEENDNKNNN